MIIAIIGGLPLIAQRSSVGLNKPPIDTAVLGKWPYVLDAQISPYGRYVSYCIERQPARSRTLVIQDTSGLWRREFRGVRQCYFCGDEKQAIFQQGDSLHFLTLRGQDSIIRIRSFRWPWSGEGKWIVYQEKGDEVLVLVNLLSREKRRLGKVVQYLLERHGKALLIREKDQELRCLELETGKIVNIWSGMAGQKAERFCFDDSGRQLAFMVSFDSGGVLKHSIWYYRLGMGSAVLKIKDGDQRFGAKMMISGTPEFSQNGRWVFFALLQPKAANPPIQAPDAVAVDIWSYKDRMLQPEQLVRGDGHSPFMAVISAGEEEFRILEDEGRRLETRSVNVTRDEVVISEPDSSGWADPTNDFTYPRNFYVQSLKDGSKKLFRKGARYLLDLHFSPEGQWLVYYDLVKESYYGFQLSSGVLKNVSSKFSVLVRSDQALGIYHPAAGPVAGWLKGDQRVLLYDNYELWAVDPSAARSGVNLTGGYGLRSRVKLRIVEESTGLDRLQVYNEGDTLLLTGFNVDNIYNGFYRLVLGKKRMPQLLTMGPYLYYRTESQTPHSMSFDDGMVPRKASRVNCWVVRRESAGEMPNIFITDDLKTYRELSHLEPQVEYNWLTAELISWRQFDGARSQGVLYKPENFDPKKKYPIIFNYYEGLSQRLYEFPMPEYITDNINIPLFVSRGYLVFTPDIHYQTASLSGKGIGYCAYNSVVSAALYLSKLPFVDSKRMGIQGHSLGGLATNYLVTHTSLFAAAAEGAGITDAVSAYLTLTPDAGGVEFQERQSIEETGQGRYGATLWQRPDLYLQQSAVLRANKVNTPLLIIHNQKDGAVQWRQGIEFYMALRRLDKRVWLLQYDEGNHGVFGRDAVDYTIRLTQFFDYYLKGELPPKWMTEGFPARMKGITNRLEVDSSGRQP